MIDELGDRGEREEKDSWEHKVSVSLLSNNKQESQHIVELLWACHWQALLCNLLSHPVLSVPFGTLGDRNFQRFSNLVSGLENSIVFTVLDCLP